MMNRHFIILITLLLPALFGGCGMEPEEPMEYFSPFVGVTLDVFFVDSEGKDLVEGIPTIKKKDDPITSRAGNLSPSAYHIKLFKDDEESNRKPSVLVYDREDVTGKPGYAIVFSFLTSNRGFNHKKIRYEFVCPYIFGDDKVHTLEGEMKGAAVIKCRFDGVEAPPAQALPDFTYYAYIVRVDR
jgi:hypothetical protein